MMERNPKMRLVGSDYYNNIERMGRTNRLNRRIHEGQELRRKESRRRCWKGLIARKWAGVRLVTVGQTTLTCEGWMN